MDYCGELSKKIIYLVKKELPLIVVMIYRKRKFNGDVGCFQNWRSSA